LPAIERVDLRSCVPMTRAALLVPRAHRRPAPSSARPPSRADQHECSMNRWLRP